MRTIRQLATKLGHAARSTPDNRLDDRALGCMLVQGPNSAALQVARTVHHQSPRAAGPFLDIDCRSSGAIGLAEALFGRATASKGALRLARGGIVLLRNVERLPSSIQTLVLGYLQDGRIMPLGARRPADSDAWVFASTRVDLRRRAVDGRFSAKLHEALSVVTIDAEGTADVEAGSVASRAAESCDETPRLRRAS